MLKLILNDFEDQKSKIDDFFIDLYTNFMISEKILTKKSFYSETPELNANMEFDAIQKIQKV